MTKKLKIGDKVKWRGTWGHDPEAIVVVKGIEITKGGKYGTPVEEINWSQVYDRNVTVDLDNDHWAYAFQIRPV